MTDLNVRTVGDSIGRRSPRLWSVETRYPQMVHQESLRHRWQSIMDDVGLNPDFSFSVSSTRAVPFAKLLFEATTDELRAAPVHWGTAQPGMVPGAEIDDRELNVNWSEIICVLYGVPPESAAVPEWITRLECCKRLWNVGGNMAGRIASIMNHTCEPHKSIPNRMIAPYIHSNVLWTGSEPGWMNFFGLRLDTAADPIIRALAERCWVEWNESTPRVLENGFWHLPYVDTESLEEAITYHSGRGELAHEPIEDGADVHKTLQLMSVARCAHLSFMSFETGKRMDAARCLSVVDKLFPGPGKPIHVSPFEHQAKVDELVAVPNAVRDTVRCPWLESLVTEDGTMWKNGHLSGNLGPGWIQLRKTLANEAVAPLPEVYRS